jgi:hypothetical protein
MDESVIDCIGVVKSLSVFDKFVEGKDENDDDVVKILSEIRDFVKRFDVLFVGNNK